MQTLRQALRVIFHPHHGNAHRARAVHAHAYFVYVILLGIFYAVFMVAQARWGNLAEVLGYASNITADQVIAETNKARAQENLEPLKANSALNAAALAKATFMFEKQFWAHSSPDGTSPWSFIKKADYNYSIAGENLAKDFATTEEMQHAWMNSKTHRQNIMNPRFSEIGVAVVDGRLFGGETTLVVEMFGRPAAGLPSLTDAAQNEAVIGEFDEAPAQNPTSIFKVDLGRVVLGQSLWPISEWHAPPLLSPLTVMKAVFLIFLMLISGTLLYDWRIAGHITAERRVGKNLAHLAFFATVIFLVIYFKSGLLNATSAMTFGS